MIKGTREANELPWLAPWEEQLATCTESFDEIVNSLKLHIQNKSPRDDGHG